MSSVSDMPLVPPLLASAQGYGTPILVVLYWCFYTRVLRLKSCQTYISGEVWLTLSLDLRSAPGHFSPSVLLCSRARS